MDLGREQYFAALSEGKTLDMRPVAELLAMMRAAGLVLEELPTELLFKSAGRRKIPEELAHLPLYAVPGPAAWGGLAVGFPGSAKQLTKEIIGAAYLSRILYPLLDLHQRLNVHYRERLPCLYLLGARFPELFERKFSLLARVVPHVVVLTSRLLRASAAGVPEPLERAEEQRVLAWLCAAMGSAEGLAVPVEGGELRLRCVMTELPTSAAPRRTEGLHLLAVNQADHALVAFGLAGPRARHVDLEALFLQGLEQREALERQRMALKLVTEGPRGRGISLKHRVRLLLGFFGDEAPGSLWELRREALRGDRSLRIDLARLAWADKERGELRVSLRSDAAP